jgi:hypothetical protein
MRLAREGSSLSRVLALCYLGVIAAAGAVLLHDPAAILRRAHCPLRDSTGLPCFTCGGTHALTALASGRLVAAFAANPLVTTVVVATIAWGLWALLATFWPPLRRNLRLSHRERSGLGWLALLAILGTWVYEIFRLT